MPKGRGLDLNQDLGAVYAEKPRSGGVRRDYRRLGMRGAGGILLLAGLVVIGSQFAGLAAHRQADAVERARWDQAVSLPQTNRAPAPATAVVPAPNGYAELGFPSLGGLKAIAGDGGWDALKGRTAVHWDKTPGPGEKGNVVFGMHREYGFQSADKLKAGDVVTVQMRSGRSFSYRIAWVRTVDPSQSKWIAPITDGSSTLTLITCTPLWVDSSRIVIRADLVAAGGSHA
jgi:LPXTG-site transpeptidase (sortase) family protein